MRRVSIIVLFLELIIAATGCEKEHYSGPEDQPVYFEYHYINHAWGFQECGWLIDREGNIRSFNLPDNYRYGVHGEMLSQEDLQHNLDQTDSIIDQIAACEIVQYIAYFPVAAEGEIWEAYNMAADAGSYRLGCYMYDPDQDAYQYILLAHSGDWCQENKSEEAEILVEWLTGFGVGFWFTNE